MSFFQVYIIILLQIEHRVISRWVSLVYDSHEYMFFFLNLFECIPGFIKVDSSLLAAVENLLIEEIGALVLIFKVLPIYILWAFFICHLGCGSLVLVDFVGASTSKAAFPF